ncbi:MAG: hypothetical protein IKD43_04505 [Clostridia bacterium]|nr:hypothetical protein [Clostridia bacterium]
MKKTFFLSGLLVPVLLLSACTGGYDYAKHLSEVKRDIFCAATEEFTVTLSCISREHPYASDGITCPMTDLTEIVLCPKDSAANYSVYVMGEQEWGGEMSFRSAQNDWFYSQSVGDFPANSVTLRVEWEGGSREIVASSVKNEHTMSAEEALQTAISHEKAAIDARMQNGSFTGEFRVRLLRRDANYYYVGIVDGNGHTISLLLCAESGEVLARRETP